MKRLLVFVVVVLTIGLVFYARLTAKEKRLIVLLSPGSVSPRLEAVEFSGQQRIVEIRDTESLARISRLLASEPADTSVLGPSYPLGVTYSVAFVLEGGERIDSVIYVRTDYWSIAGESAGLMDSKLYVKKLPGELPRSLSKAIDCLLSPAAPTLNPVVF